MVRMEITSFLSMILMFSLIEPTKEYFNMITSKKYDHYFLDYYQADFETHLKRVSEEKSLETELSKFAKEVDSGGLARKWANFEGWNDAIFTPLHQHFLFAVRSAMDIKHMFPILVYMHVKYQAFLHAITYMNGAILLPENDRKAVFCRGIAFQLLYFSDVGTMDLLKKLEAILKLKIGEEHKITIKILQTLNTWTIAANIIWERFQPRLMSLDTSKNSSKFLEMHYEQLRVDQDNIMIQSRKAMMSLFEGIKQCALEPILPPMDRLTLNIGAASTLWDKAETLWVKNFWPSKGKFQLKEMIMENNMIEMRYYSELNANNEQEMEFDHLKSLNSLIFHKKSGIIELAKIDQETGTTKHRDKMKKEIEKMKLETLSRLNSR